MGYAEFFAHLVGAFVGAVVGAFLGVIAGIVGMMAVTAFNVWMNPDQPDAASIGIMVIATAPMGGLAGILLGAILGWRMVAWAWDRDERLRHPAPISTYWPPYPTQKPTNPPDELPPTD